MALNEAASLAAHGVVIGIFLFVAVLKFCELHVPLLVPLSLVCYYYHTLRGSSFGSNSASPGSGQ